MRESPGSYPPPGRAYRPVAEFCDGSYGSPNVTHYELLGLYRHPGCLAI
jgi:hypothetical protein